MANNNSLFGDIYNPELLENLLVGVPFSTDKYKADMIAPRVSTPKTTGFYFLTAPYAFAGIADDTKGDYSRPNQITEKTISQEPFRLDTHALTIPMAFLDLVQADPVLTLSTYLANTTRAKMLNIREKSLADLIFDENNFAANLKNSPTTKWSDPTSEPRDDINTGKEAAVTAGGEVPNTILISKIVADELAKNDNIQGWMADNAARDVTASVLQNYFDVDEVIITPRNAVIREEEVGAANKTLTKIWGPNALLYYKGSSNIAEPNFVRGFILGTEGEQNFFELVDVYDKESKVTRLSMYGYYKYIITYPESGYLLYDLIA